MLHGASETSTMKPPPVVAPCARTQAEAQALIEEARAHAWRRRRKSALAVIIVAAAVGGGVAGAVALSGGRAAAHSGASRSVSVAAHTGAVTGYIDPCEGIPIPGAPYAAGTVTALRGRQTWKLVASESNRTYQTYHLVLPTTVAARQHVSENQKFYFDLPPGQYVVVARYDRDGAMTFLDVSISARRVLHENLPDLCK
jgi:hypothetical protein